jgi:hypothetical protein
MPNIEASLREFVRLRAAGLCEYCGISERFTLAEYEIDRVIAVKHGGQTVVENLALCCVVCNRFKGGDIASIDPGTGHLAPCFIRALIAGTTTERQLLAALKPS